MGSRAVVQGLAGRENYQARRFRRSCSVFGCIVRFATTLAHPHSLQRRRVHRSLAHNTGSGQLGESNCRTGPQSACGVHQ
jgi:hypothetical protein